MTHNLQIQKIDENEEHFTFEVKISDKTKHTVVLDKDYYAKLSNGKIRPEELIEKSFEFLLEREAAEQILSEFNLKEIQNYFPGYKNTICA
ncbi:hypothetical protein ACFLY0_02290 [Patescibacteria group bacterium]